MCLNKNILYKYFVDFSYSAWLSLKKLKENKYKPSLTVKTREVK